MSYNDFVFTTDIKPCASLFAAEKKKQKKKTHQNETKISEMVVDSSEKIKETIGLSIDHFTVVCSVTWNLNGSEAAGDLVLIKTSLPCVFRAVLSVL